MCLANLKIIFQNTTMKVPRSLEDEIMGSLKSRMSIPERSRESYPLGKDVVTVPISNLPRIWERSATQTPVS